MIKDFNFDTNTKQLIKDSIKNAMKVTKSTGDKMLHSHTKHLNMDFEEVTELYIKMRKETLIKQYCDTNKIKERTAGKYTQFYICIKDKYVAAKTRSELIDKLFDTFCGESVITLEEAFKEWMQWRASINVSSKTLKENKCEWDKYIKGSALSKMQVAKIEISDFEDFLYEITKDYAITSKRLSNIITVLNGILRRCVSRKIIPHNLLADVDKKVFHNRCKPANTEKEIYSKEEREKILDFLKDKNDAYSLAIRFAFYLPLRFSETAAIKYNDIKDGNLKIQRAQRTCRKMDENLNFKGRYLTNDERIKGNKESGFRTVPLTKSALEIVELAHKLNPDNEFLFMFEGRQLNGNTYNEKLQKICNILNIKYRPSHEQRFTVATMLFQQGMPINKLSVFLGHSTVSMTWHYIRQQTPSNNDLDIMEAALD